MNISRRGLLAGAGAAVVAASVPAWLLSRRPEAGAQAGRPEHVILVDWDGFDPDYLGLAPTPNIDSLAERGSLSVAESIYPTISNPARASMSTGAYPERHGNAAYFFDEGAGEAVGETRSLAAETIVQALAAEGRTTAAVQWYMVQDHGASYGDPEHLYVRPGGLFERRVDEAVEILHGRPVGSGGKMVTVPKVPDFLAVYGPDLDAFGHLEGPDSPNIGSLVAQLDRQLGRIVQAAKDVGIYGQTAFILTSDHGMTGWGRSLLEEFVATPGLGRGVELVPPGRAPSPDTEVVLVKSGGRVMDVTLRGRARTPERLAEVRRALEGLPQVGRVLGAADLEALRAGDKVGDFLVETKTPWGFGSEEPEGGASRGGHGSTQEMRVPLLISGAGVRVGAVAEGARIVDVAPTVAALLGVRPPADAQGRVLEELLHG